jgi:hypothetical protein
MLKNGRYWRKADIRTLNGNLVPKEVSDRETGWGCSTQFGVTLRKFAVSRIVFPDQLSREMLEK